MLGRHLGAAVFVLVAATENLAAQGSTKSARAIRITGSAPRIDGVLDDAAWANAPVIADFVQKIPSKAAAPSVTTEVRLVYDDHGLYVGARLKRRDPDAIRTSITRRDGDSDAEVFTVSLDPYLDRRTAYSFSISSGGVRGDAYHSQDSEDSGREAQFDPIWNARARVDADGWTAEMRIPFSQLRFNAAAGADVGTRADAQRRRQERTCAVGADSRLGGGLRVAIRTTRGDFRHSAHPAGWS